MDNAALTMLVTNLLLSLLVAVAAAVIVRKAGFPFLLWGGVGLGLMAVQFFEGVLPIIPFLSSGPSVSNYESSLDTYYVINSGNIFQSIVMSFALAAFAFSRWPALSASPPSKPPKGQA